MNFKTKKPKIALLCAHAMGFKVAEHILDSPYPIELIATCDRDDTEFESQISNLAVSHSIPLYPRTNANSDDFLAVLKEAEIDLVLLIWWPSIIKKRAIDVANLGWINMHNSLLPYCRGRHPYYWSVVDKVPYGVTLHYIDEGIDSGDVLFQRSIDIKVNETGAEIYEKSLEQLFLLFTESFPKIATLDYSPSRQDHEVATFHWDSDLHKHSEINLEETYKAEDLINILRARSFPNGDSAFFYHKKKKYNIRVTIEEVPGK